METRKKESLKMMFGHFLILVSLYSQSKIHKKYQKAIIHKRGRHETNLMVLKTKLLLVNSNSINHSTETNPKYETFFEIFSELCKKSFPLKDFQMKETNLQVPWISKELKNIKY